MRFFGWLTAATLIARPLVGQVVDSGVAIPMRDGVVLRATILKPARTGSFPVLVYRTPYGAASAVRTYSIFRRAVERGYAVVAQDVRGRYQSDGEFDPYRQERHDGYDTIEWAAKQPWSDGNVGTFGLSYPGAVQWLAAIEQPPHLKAMVPAMTYSQAGNFWYAGGLPDLSWPSWIWHNIAPDVRRRKNLPGPKTAREADSTWKLIGDSLVNRLPITNVPELAQVAPWYLEWLSHPPNDPWWDWTDLTNKYSTVTAAVLNLSGWHDDNYGPEGALTNHRGLLAARAGAADPKTQLIMGPWPHGVGGMAKRAPTKPGDRDYGPNAAIDYDEEILQFMDHYVRDLPNRVAESPRFRIFIMGENTWTTSNTWPLPGTKELRLDFGPEGLAERRVPSAERRDYETSPFTSDVRVVGNIQATLFVSTDAPDADVWLRLYDVAPDGTTWDLMSPGLDVQRLSTRPGATPLVPGRPVEVRLTNLMTGNQFKRGHRLRAVFMTSFMPYFSRNLQTGRSETESAEFRPAKVTLHVGPDYPSHLILPVLP